MANRQLRFYGFEPKAPPSPPELPAGLAIRSWSLGDGQAIPPRAPRYVTIYSMAAMLGLFARPQIAFVSVERDDRVIHHLLVTARYFRFPDMAPDDLQVGALWSDPHARGQGAATLAVRFALSHFSGSYRRMWGILEEDNLASRRVFEKAGFEFIGRGVRTRPFGIGLMGAFRMTTPI